MKPRFFRTQAALRSWLESHHADAVELLVGFYRRGSGRATLTWPQSVDEALSFGWIDGVRRSIDAQCYSIRFTPRRAGSRWSAVNVRKAEALVAAGRMHATGLAAFRSRRANRTAQYSYEQRPAQLTEPYAGQLRRNAAARRFFDSQTPSYRRAATWWVISARQEATRLRRSARLIEHSARAELIPQFRRRPGRT
jgi:uncharacterized protein YdeI (YjbR/CyaY-like superfamily)